MKRFPDFLVIGAAKSGTTSVWEALGQHPGIFMTRDIAHKELGYFCDYYGIKNEEEYLSYFKDARPDQLIGEACHLYLSSPESPSKICDFRKDMKLIAVLRNPVDRAFSLYNWMVMEGYEFASTFEEALDLEYKRKNNPEFIQNNPQGCYMNYLYFESGLYDEQILRYYEKFNHDNILFLFYEDLRSNPDKELKKIFAFLKLPELNNIKLPRTNESKAVRSVRLQFYFKNKLQGHLVKLFFSKRRAYRISLWLMNLNKSKNRPRPLNERTRMNLNSKYKSSINNLSIVLNRDCKKLWGIN